MKRHSKHLIVFILLLIFAAGCASRDVPELSAPESPPAYAESVPPVSAPSAVPEILPAAPQSPAPEAQPEQEVLTEQEPQPKPEAESTLEQERPPEQEAPPEPESTPEPEPPPEQAPPSPASLPVLMYHHVVPDGTTCNDMTVTVSKLSSDLEWLAQHGYETILPRDLVSGEPLPEKPVLITFDDGYRSNYELAYPLFQQHQAKAVISIMVYMQDTGVTSFLSWDMCREMADSGLVEIGSHTYYLHNLGERGGNFIPGGINGIQRDPTESEEAFRVRVLDDLQKSHDLIEEHLAQEVTFFAYPFGIREPEAESLINELFPVTAVTLKGTAQLSDGIRLLPRWTVTMNTSLSSILEA